MTRPVEHGGHGFDFKWDLGCTSHMMKFFRAPYGRAAAVYNDLTYPMLYHHTENFLLPLGHDEVVHMKRTHGQQDGGPERLRQVRQPAVALPAPVRLSAEETAVHGPGVRPEERVERRGAAAVGVDLGPPAPFAAVVRQAAQRGVQVRSGDARGRQHPQRLRVDRVPEPPAGASSPSSATTANYSDLLVYLLNLSRDYFPEFRLGVPFAGQVLQGASTPTPREFGGNGHNWINEYEAVPHPAFHHPHSFSTKLLPLHGMIFRAVAIQR